MNHVSNDAILDAAAAVFAARGYEGARVDEIASAANVNKATLYYRVGDKAALYGTVLERLLRTTADRIIAAMAAAGTPEDKVRAYVRAFAACAGERPEFAPLMMHEVAGGGANVPDAALRQMGRIVNALDEAVREGTAQGSFRPVNPFVAHMLVVGSVSFFNAGAPIRARVAASQGLDFRPDVLLADGHIAEHLAELVLGGLRQDRTTTR